MISPKVEVDLSDLLILLSEASRTLDADSPGFYAGNRIRKEVAAQIEVVID